jgi:hypothetical protein
MSAEVYYPITEVGPYGNTIRQWVFDQTVPCQFVPAGSDSKEEVKPEILITQDTLLVGRVKNDIRISKRNDPNALTNIIVTNIRDGSCNELYTETTGPRAGKSTIFEVATQQPYVGPFGGIDFHKIVLRKSENQATEV